MTDYENFKRMLEVYLRIIGASRIKIQAAECQDEDIVIPTASSIRRAYFVTKFLDRLFSKPRSIIRLVGRGCEWNNLESYINEIKDLQAERKEAFEPFARICEETKSGIAVRHIKPCEEWLDAVSRFNSLLTNEELEIKLIIAKAAKSMKNGLLSKPPKQAQRIGTINNTYHISGLDEGIGEAIKTILTKGQRGHIRAINKALGKCHIIVEEQPPTSSAERERFIQEWRTFQSEGSRKTQTYQAFWDEYGNIPLGYGRKTPSEMFEDNIGNMIRFIKAKTESDRTKRKKSQTPKQ